MGCRKSHTENTGETNDQMGTIQIDGKLYNQDITIRKGMKTGAQLGRTDDWDIKGGFQIMFTKRKVKNYTQTVTASQWKFLNLNQSSILNYYDLFSVFKFSPQKHCHKNN